MDEVYAQKARGQLLALSSNLGVVRYGVILPVSVSSISITVRGGVIPIVI